ncbi:hypothetical protein FACS1894176_01090 [Bacteroidia bacterium]|nr:hypothetical protein FACS189428_3950 [Clostridia bacterium]GHV24530.1 hypothetical protein FACS1894176_01090 [Bacteroidia bacterium]
MGKEWEEWLEKEETDGALAHRTYTALKIFAIYLVFAGIVGIGAVLTSQEEPWTWAIFGSMVIEIIFLYFWKIVPILKE